MSNLEIENARVTGSNPYLDEAMKARHFATIFVEHKHRQLDDFFFAFEVEHSKEIGHLGFEL